MALLVVKARGVPYFDIDGEVAFLVKSGMSIGLSNVTFYTTGVSVEYRDSGNPALNAALVVTAKRMEQALKDLAWSTLVAITPLGLAVASLAAAFKSRANPAVVGVRWVGGRGGWHYEDGFKLLDAVTDYYARAPKIIGYALLSWAVTNEAITRPSQALRWAAEALRSLPSLASKHVWSLAVTLVHRIASAARRLKESYSNATANMHVAAALQAAEATGDPDAVEYAEALHEAHKAVAEMLESIRRLVNNAYTVLDYLCCKHDTPEEAAKLLEQAAAEAERYEGIIARAADKLRAAGSRLERKAELQGPFLVGRGGHAAAKA